MFLLAVRANVNRQRGKGTRTHTRNELPRSFCTVSFFLTYDSNNTRSRIPTAPFRNTSRQMFSARRRETAERADAETPSFVRVGGRSRRRRTKKKTKNRSRDVIDAFFFYFFLFFLDRLSTTMTYGP